MDYDWLTGSTTSYSHIRPNMGSEKLTWKLVQSPLGRALVFTGPPGRYKQLSNLDVYVIYHRDLVLALHCSSTISPSILNP